MRTIYVFAATSVLAGCASRSRRHCTGLRLAPSISTLFVCAAARGGRECVRARRRRIGSARPERYE
jgi:hypothetical protein